MRRLIIAAHRWLGVALCLLFLLWFPSGIVMMYWDFPSVTSADRLERSPALDASRIALSPAEAFATLAIAAPPAHARLNTFDGRPVYRFSADGEEAVVYADTGERRTAASPEMMQRIAAAWTRQPAASATITPVTQTDQWTVQGSLKTLRPLWKFTWPDGEDVYVSQASGEVMQYTTTALRMGAYFGAIPHWFYFTPLRVHEAQWSRLVIWSSGLGTLAAVLGLVIGVWMFSPSKQYRYAGAPARIPYSGPKRWHAVLGLAFGLAAATWTFSGMLSMDPFPSRTDDVRRSGGAGPTIAKALSGPLQLDEFEAKHPRIALKQLGTLQVRELELTSFAGQPAYIATVGRETTRMVPVDGEPRPAFDRSRIADIITRAARADGVVVDLIERYDSYYRDRRHARALPVLRARTGDRGGTYYIDPRTARVVASYDSGNWVNRWLYHGLHSLDFPWLYDHRPAWDFVVATFMVGGTALCVTALILAWQVLGRTLSRGR